MTTPIAASQLPSVSNKELDAALAAHGTGAWRLLVSKHGRSFRLGKVVATAEPELANALLTGRDHRDLRPKGYLDHARWMAGQRGLVFIDGERWLAQTRALVPMLAKPHVRAVSRSVTTTVATAVDRWFDEGGLDDAADACQRLNDAVFLRGAFGETLGDRAAALGTSFRQWLATQHDDRARFDAPTQKIGALFGLPFVLRRARQAFVEVGRERARLIDGVTPDATSWIARLEAEAVKGEDADAALTHLFWAADALAYVLTCSLVSLATQPRAAAVVREEVARVVGSAPLDWDTLENLPQTRAFVREVLRTFPATMGVLRRTGAQLETATVMLEKDRDVLILLQALHHDPQSFAAPDAFDPSRWLDGWTPTPGSWIPFVAGPRKCAGQALAELVAGSFVASIARRGEATMREAVPPLGTFMIPRHDGRVRVALEAASAPRVAAV